MSTAENSERSAAENFQRNCYCYYLTAENSKRSAAKNSERNCYCYYSTTENLKRSAPRCDEREPGQEGELAFINFRVSLFFC